jgi:hypothetical protein
MVFNAPYLAASCMASLIESIVDDLVQHRQEDHRAPRRGHFRAVQVGRRTGKAHLRVMRHPESFWATHLSAACRRLPDPSHSSLGDVRTSSTFPPELQLRLARRYVRARRCRRRSPRKRTQVPDPRRSARTPRQPRCGSGFPVKVEFPFGVEYQ